MEADQLVECESEEGGSQVLFDCGWVVFGIRAAESKASLRNLVARALVYCNGTPSVEIFSVICRERDGGRGKGQGGGRESARARGVDNSEQRGEIFCVCVMQAF